jgi:hypothetical protein
LSWFVVSRLFWSVLFALIWAFSSKEINQFLTSSQIERFLGLGLKNRCFSFYFDFSLIGFKLDNDLLEVAPLLPCDHAHQVSWQLVKIWVQIGRSKWEAIWGRSCSVLVRNSRTVRRLTADGPLIGVHQV